MTTGLLVGAIVAVLLVIVAAVSAAAETALTRISRARAEGLAADDNNGVEALVELLVERETSLAPLLLLRVGAQVGVIAIVVTLVADRTATGGVVGAAVGAVIGLYVFAEAIPRIWALQHIDRAALAIIKDADIVEFGDVRMRFGIAQGEDALGGDETVMVATSMPSSVARQKRGAA